MHQRRPEEEIRRRLSQCLLDIGRDGQSCLNPTGGLDQIQSVAAHPPPVGRLEPPRATTQRGFVAVGLAPRLLGDHRRQPERLPQAPEAGAIGDQGEDGVAAAAEELGEPRTDNISVVERMAKEHSNPHRPASSTQSSSFGIS